LARPVARTSKERIYIEKNIHPVNKKIARKSEVAPIRQTAKSWFLACLFPYQAAFIKPWP
jgi:hypothetical protein